MRTTTTRKTVSELLATEDAPLPLAVIPNYMGINLCSVDSLSWTKREDGQLVDLTIHFIPAEDSPRPDVEPTTERTTISDFLDRRLREEKGSDVEKLAVVSATQLSVFCAWLLANGMSAEQARAFFETALDGADRLLPQKFRKKL